MYCQSASADLTPQGRAIRDASIRFGDGETLPFRTCKKGYLPTVDRRKMYACYLHSRMREERFQKEGNKFRHGEVDLAETFWSRDGLIDDTDGSDSD
mmetsp:Transcript_5167/g.8796  ORF Transcript_5167/g.8796 Transcript_5167/m.8796 type:complete len:97 (+) Transcript_5167:419-709(+)